MLIYYIYYIIYLYKQAIYSMLRGPKRHGRPAFYQSKDERYEARKARQREKYWQDRARKQHSTFYNTFQTAIEPALSIPSLEQLALSSSTNPYNFPSITIEDDRFIPIQVEDEFEELLLLQSPSLSSAAIDISEVESCESEIEESI
jgi:hypothetical protein